MRAFAECLVTLEAVGSKSPKPTIPEAFLACEKLRLPLATLLGSVGFSALLSRALALAATEVKWLHALSVDADGSLDGLAEPPAQVPREESVKGGVVLLAHLLGLLATFIGEELTLQLVQEIWPKFVFDSPDLAKGNKK